MKYSQMSPRQRKELLENPDNYPLYVTFLNKTGLLTFEQVAFLREHDVDFDVEDRLAEVVLGRAVVRRAAEERREQEALEEIEEAVAVETPPARRQLDQQLLMLNLRARLARVLPTILSILMSALRAFPALANMAAWIVASALGMIPAGIALLRRIIPPFRDRQG